MCINLQQTSADQVADHDSLPAIQDDVDDDFDVEDEFDPQQDGPKLDATRRRGERRSVGCAKRLA